MGMSLQSQGFPLCHGVAVEADWYSLLALAELVAGEESPCSPNPGSMYLALVFG